MIKRKREFSFRWSYFSFKNLCLCFWESGLKKVLWTSSFAWNETISGKSVEIVTGGRLNQNRSLGIQTQTKLSIKEIISINLTQCMKKKFLHSMKIGPVSYNGIWIAQIFLHSGILYVPVYSAPQKDFCSNFCYFSPASLLAIIHINQIKVILKRDYA